MRFLPVSSKELWLAEGALFLAILLQIAVAVIGPELTVGPQYLIIATEIALAVTIAFTSTKGEVSKLHRPLALLLIGLLSLANISSFVLVGHMLVTTGNHVTGPELLIAAIAIFLTNVIVFALWYWELDSPGLSGSKWSRNTQDFLFPQQNMEKDFPHWQPGLVDYLYLSLTNGINFAPADTRPLTAQAKSLMGIQALVSIFAVALVLARSINILGQ